MKVTICRLDSSFFLSEEIIGWLVQSIDSFKKQVSPEELASAKLHPGVALAYYARHAFNNKDGNTYTFDPTIISPEKRDSVYGMGNKNSLSSWCRLMGLLYDDEGKFGLGEIAEKLFKTKKISAKEFCFMILAKQWVCINRECKRSLLAVIYDILSKENNTFIQDLNNYVQSNKELQKKLQNDFFKEVAGRDREESDEVQFTRFDTLRYVLWQAGILEEVSDRQWALTEDGEYVLEDFKKHEGRLTKYEPGDLEFHQYMSAIENGVFDIISHDNSIVYKDSYPNLVELAKALEATAIIPTIAVSEPLQQVRYGAPGTGKSFTIDKITKKYSNTIRTTFHPDTDYASFVGSYKPTTSKHNCYGLTADGSTKYVYDLNANEPLTESRIEYKFVKQAFIKAYVQAWKLFKTSFKTGTILQPQFLVIEEINRGNCAQIFGDLFQLLDRKQGFSEYPILADDDIRRSLLEESNDGLSFGENGLQLTLRQRAAINKIYDTPGAPSRGMADKICNGEFLALPCNFYICATMNTSDQSLFPMDSAFKRRWSWIYEPINYVDASKFLIEIGKGDSKTYYPWDEFLLRINKKIASNLHSSAKQIGNRFIKTDSTCKVEEKEFFTISENDFINKVIFYLFSDVYKDDDSFGTYFFDKDENSEEVWLFENIFDITSDSSHLCKSFLDRLAKDYNINDYIQSKANK